MSHGPPPPSCPVTGTWADLQLYEESLSAQTDTAAATILALAQDGNIVPTDNISVGGEEVAVSDTTHTVSNVEHDNTVVNIQQYIEDVLKAQLVDFKKVLFDEIRGCSSNPQPTLVDDNLPSRSEDTYMVNRPAAISQSARQTASFSGNVPSGQIPPLVSKGKAKAGVAHLIPNPQPVDRGVLSLFHSDSEFEEEGGRMMVTTRILPRPSLLALKLMKLPSWYWWIL